MSISKAYCQERLCEIPVVVFKTKQAHKNNFFTSREFQTIDLKANCPSSWTKNCTRIDEGCIEAVINSLIEMDDVLPLREYQFDVLFDIGIATLVIQLTDMTIFLWQHLTTCGYDLSAIKE